MSRTIALVALLCVSAAFAADINMRNYTLPGQGTWAYIAPDALTAAVAASDGGDGNIYVVTLKTGNIVTIAGPAPTSGNSQGYLCVSEKMVYVSTANGLQAYNFQGKMVWSDSSLYNAGGPAYSKDNKAVYVVSRDSNHMYAYDAESGTPLWNITTMTFKTAAPFVMNSGQTLIISDTNGNLLGIDPSTQKVSWKVPQFNAWYNSAHIEGFADDSFASKVLVVITTDGYIAKIDVTSGSVMWKVPHVNINWGSAVADVTATQSSFNYWCLNNSNVVQMDQGDGSQDNVAPAKSTTVNGLINLNNDWILSFPGDNTINYYDEMDGSYQGKVTMEGVGTDLTSFKASPDNQIGVAIFNSNTIVVLSSGGWKKNKKKVNRVRRH